MTYLYREKTLQHLGEHDAFLRLIADEGVRSYLEIGAMYGGSLWRTAWKRPSGSRVVAVDIGEHVPVLSHLRACVAELYHVGYDAHLIIGDSRAPKTIAKARAFGPFDCVFIDGHHTVEAVRSDWESYGPMARIVAFHDIGWDATQRRDKGVGVRSVWDSIRADYRHVEIKLHGPSPYYGIGVLWRA